MWITIEDKRSQQNDADVIICVTDPSKVLKGELYVFERLPERFLKLVVEIPPSWHRRKSASNF